jgi:hypothetical protein
MNCNFDVIPHYSQGYLNSIIISLIFNTEFRKLLNFNNNRSNIFKGFIKGLIDDNNDNNDKLDIYKKTSYRDLLESLEPKSYKRTSWMPDYITKVYKLLDINFINLIYDVSNNKYIINVDETTNTTNPDVIVLYHSKLNTNSHYYINKFRELSHKNKESAVKYEASNYGFNFKGVDTYENEITVNGIIYELQNCFLSNHTSTLGFICSNNRFVYNYWKLPSVSNCGIVKFNWNLKQLSDKDKTKCFDRSNCNIPSDSKRCFSFANDNKILVYLKKDNSEIMNKSKSKDKSKSLIINKSKSKDKSFNKSLIMNKSKDKNKSKSLIMDKSKSKDKSKSLKKNDKDYIINLLISKLKKKNNTN